MRSSILRMCLFCLAMVFAYGTANGAVILQYHHVSTETPASTSISPELFARHMDYLEAENYRVWPLERLIEHIRSGKTVPDRVVVITFDDAYLSIYEAAYPLLKKRDWPFTVFVATDPVAQQPKAFMSWQQLRTLTENGGLLANHTRTHAHLVRKKSGESEKQWLQRVRREIIEAQAELESKTGTKGKYLAYPYGEFTAQIQSLVRDLGFVAFGQHSGAVGAEHDLTALPRFPMTDFFGEMSQFKSKVDSLPWAEISVDPAERIVEEDDLLADGLKLRLRPVDANPDQLACYLSGQGRAETEVRRRDDSILVELTKGIQLQPGRSRVNCTIPSRNPDYAGRFYWYSHFWMRLLPSGEWYPEP